jgi:hypothetical protein
MEFYFGAAGLTFGQMKLSQYCVRDSVSEPLITHSAGFFAVMLTEGIPGDLI